MPLDLLHFDLALVNHPSRTFLAGYQDLTSFGELKRRLSDQNRAAKALEWSLRSAKASQRCGENSNLIFHIITVRALRCTHSGKECGSNSICLRLCPFARYIEDTFYLLSQQKSSRLHFYLHDMKFSTTAFLAATITGTAIQSVQTAHTMACTVSHDGQGTHDR